MQSHRASLPAEAAEGHTHLAHAVVRYLGLNTPAGLAMYGIKNAADVVDLISRVGFLDPRTPTPILTSKTHFAVHNERAYINISCSHTFRCGHQSGHRPSQPLLRSQRSRGVSPYCGTKS